MSIQLITFDLDDTFWHAAPTIDQAEQVLRDWLSLNAPQLGLFSLERLAAYRQHVLARDPELRHRVSTLRRQVLLHALAEAGYSGREAEQTAEQAFQVFLEARHAVQVFPEVRPLLDSLRDGYRLGVLTNGNADVQRLGLGHYFQFALSAEALGVGKPDARPFREALQRAGVQPEQAVHVGDHPVDDINGAQQAGIRAIWFNPSAKPWSTAEHGNRPDAEIRSLAEVSDWVAAWTARG